MPFVKVEAQIMEKDTARKENEDGCHYEERKQYQRC